MLDLHRLLRPWKEASAFCDYVDMQACIDEGIFLTKGGHIGMMLEVKGIDYESVTATALDSYTGRYEKACKLFDDTFHIVEYFFKDNCPEIEEIHYQNPVTEAIVGSRIQYLKDNQQRLHTTRVVLCITLDTTDSTSKLDRFRTHLSEFDIKGLIDDVRNASSKKKALFFANNILNTYVQTLKDRVHSFRAAIADFCPMRQLSTEGCFFVLQHLTNFDKQLRAMPMPEIAIEEAAYCACHQNFDKEPDGIRLDDHSARVYTLKTFPRRSRPNILEPLTKLKGSYYIASYWNPEKPATTLARVKRKIGHNDATKVGVGKKGYQRVDKTKDVATDELEAINIEIARNNRYLGYYSQTVVLYDKNPSELLRLEAELIQAANKMGIQYQLERRGAAVAYFATLPGQQKRLSKRIKCITESNFADLGLYFTVDTGSKSNPHLRREYHAVFTTTTDEPYYLNFHHGRDKEVAHSLGVGPTGSGKTYLSNYLLGQTTKYDAHITTIDLADNYLFLTKTLQGTYTSISSGDRKFRLNPLRLPNTPDNLDFLTAWVCALLELNVRQEDYLTDKEKDGVFQKIKEHYEFDESERRLSTLARTLDIKLQDRLHRWLEGGQFGNVFDDPSCEDALSMSRVQTFSFKGFKEKPDLLQPILFYVLYKTMSVIRDNSILERFKLLNIDEAWIFLTNPRIRGAVVELLKAGRYSNAAVWLWTQNVEDMDEELLKIMADNCPTRIFLANPKVDKKKYHDNFGLSPDACDLIMSLTPNRQFLYTTKSGVSKRLNLDVGKKEWWIYGNSTFESARRERVMRLYNQDLGAALDHLVKHPDPTEEENALVGR